MSQLEHKIFSKGMEFTESEFRIYQEMLQRPEVCASDLHKLVGLNRSRTYAVLTDMVGKGFCFERVSGRKRFYRAVKPSDLLKNLEEIWKNRDHQAKKLFGNLNNLYLNNNLSPIDKTAELITNASFTNQRYIELFHETETEILSFIRSPWVCLTNRSLAQQQKVARETYARGVTGRSLVSFAGKDIEWLQRIMKSQHELGNVTRANETLPIKMFIFDKKTVMLALPDEAERNSEEFTTIVLNNPGYTQSCIELFESYWQDSEEIDHFHKIQQNIKQNT